MMKDMYLALSFAVAAANAACGASTAPFDDASSSGFDGGRGPFAHDLPLAPVPCNGAPCSGLCVALPTGGADVPGGTPRPPSPEAGSGATCQEFPPAYCRTMYDTAACTGAHADCCEWLRRACMFGTSIVLDSTGRYGSCPTGGRASAATSSSPIFAECGSVAEYFARMTELERDAIEAFERLASELAAHGAAPSLIDAARAAADDERRHAAWTERWTDCAPCAARRGEHAPRSRFELAVDNAREGCVRETLAAAIAIAQASGAADESLRAGFAAIARDESRHSDFSWRLHDWLRASLSLSERAQVDRVMAEAVDECLAASAAEPPAWASRLGLPSSAVYRALVEQLRSTVWAQA